MPSMKNWARVVPRSSSARPDHATAAPETTAPAVGARISHTGGASSLSIVFTRTSQLAKPGAETEKVAESLTASASSAAASQTSCGTAKLAGVKTSAAPLTIETLGSPATRAISTVMLAAGDVASRTSKTAVPPSARFTAVDETMSPGSGVIGASR